MTYKKLYEHIRLGHGIDHGSSYKPWFTLRRKNPSPKSNQVVSWMPPLRRTAHYFSRGECHTVFLLLWLALSDAASRQGTLFDDVAGDERAAKLMGVVDALNRQHGRDTVQMGAAGIQARWAMRADNRTPRYTTSWDELPKVWAK